MARALATSGLARRGKLTVNSLERKANYGAPLLGSATRTARGLLG